MSSYYQKQFLPFAAGGAPNIHSLSNSRTQSHVLVTTDRSVGVLQYDDASCEYALHELALERFASADTEVIASGVIEYPGHEAIAVAYADDDKLYLHVAAADELLRDASPVPAQVSNSTNSSTRKSKSSSIRFELVAAPTAIASVTALAATGAPEQFFGVLLFRDGSMAAFGFIDDVHTRRDGAAAALPQCARLSSEQFSRFFPELATFAHAVLAVDALLLPATETSWLALGCADGLVRVLCGRMERGCSCGPFEMRDFQIDGPVTAVALFATPGATTDAPVKCNVLATCAIGHALVVDDVFRTTSPTPELLAGSDAFDSVFAGVALDIDLDGRVELLLGTDDQLLLAYKRTAMRACTMQRDAPAVVSGVAAVTTDSSARVEPQRRTNVQDDLTSDTVDSSTALSSHPPSDSIATSTSTAEPVGSHAATQQCWSLLPTTHWRVQVFGAIYSLARLDVNRDGVDELLVASSTGVFVFETDAAVVLRRLEALLASATL